VLLARLILTVLELPAPLPPLLVPRLLLVVESLAWIAVLAAGTPVTSARIPPGRIAATRVLR
jgi:hypothetical protein